MWPRWACGSACARRCRTCRDAATPMIRPTRRLGSSAGCCAGRTSWRGWRTWRTTPPCPRCWASRRCQASRPCRASSPRAAAGPARRLAKCTRPACGICRSARMATPSTWIRFPSCTKTAGRMACGWATPARGSSPAIAPSSRRWPRRPTSRTSGCDRATPRASPAPTPSCARPSGACRPTCASRCCGPTAAFAPDRFWPRCAILASLTS